VRRAVLVKWHGKISPAGESNGIQKHEGRLRHPRARRECRTFKKELSRKKMAERLQGHLAGYTNLAHGPARARSPTGAGSANTTRRPDGPARGRWRWHIGVKGKGSGGIRSVTSVPLSFNMLMTPMEKMDQGVTSLAPPPAGSRLQDVGA